MKMWRLIPGGGGAPREPMPPDVAARVLRDSSVGCGTLLVCVAGAVWLISSAF